MAATVAILCAGAMIVPQQRAAAAPNAGASRNASEIPLPMSPERQKKQLNFLFGALKAAPSDAAAKYVERKIMQLWLTTPSYTVNVLMTRMSDAVLEGNLNAAFAILNRVIELSPRYSLARSMRAELYLGEQQFGDALVDLRVALAADPRNYQALVIFGKILMQFEKNNEALVVFRRALEIDPHLKQVQGIVKRLHEELEGIDI